jgi:hypothetical protein
MCTLIVLFEVMSGQMGYGMMAATDNGAGMWMKGFGTNTRPTLQPSRLPPEFEPHTLLQSASYITQVAET